MRRWAWAVLALALSGCVMRPEGPDQGAESVPIVIRLRITPASRVADPAALRAQVLKIPHVTAVNLLEFGQVPDDQTDGTLPVYELQCAARTANVGLSRIYDALIGHGYEATDLLINVNNDDDAFTILLDSLCDYSRTRGIALAAEELPINTAEAMLEVRALRRMGDASGARVTERVVRGFPAGSDEAMFLYAFILDRMEYRPAIAPLTAFLKSALALRARPDTAHAWRRSTDMAALALQHLLGLAKVTPEDWSQNRQRHITAILAAADRQAEAPPGKPTPAKLPPGLR